MLKRIAIQFACCALFTFSGASAFADQAESAWTLTGFASVNYSLSSSEVPYDGLIDDGGSLQASSILGLQTNYRFNNDTHASVQFALARKAVAENGLEPDIRWAYLSHRLDNGVTFRLGRQRLNLYRNSENLEIGSTYTMATLPDEIYVNPDYLSTNGLSVRKRFFREGGQDTEIGLLAGARDIELQTGTSTNDANIQALNFYIEHVITMDTNVFLGYAKVNIDLPFQGSELDPRGSTTSLAINHHPQDYSLNFEYSHTAIDTTARLANGTSPIGSQFRSDGLAVTVEKDMGRIRPYISLARYLSDSSTKGNFTSSRLGLAYRYNMDTLLKAELHHASTDSNPGITFFDLPAGSSQSANILTLSYNRIF